MQRTHYYKNEEKEEDREKVEGEAIKEHTEVPPQFLPEELNIVPIDDDGGDNEHHRHKDAENKIEATTKEPQKGVLIGGGEYHFPAENDGFEPVAEPEGSESESEPEVPANRQNINLNIVSLEGDVLEKERSADNQDDKENEERKEHEKEKATQENIVDQELLDALR